MGRHENNEKRLFFFGLRILLPIHNQLLEIENPKIYPLPSNARGFSVRLFLTVLVLNILGG
jgi:hypothetical protein